MIPTFPKFKKLELSDKTEIELITGEYTPYSDFSFVSMWAWDIKGEMEISQLNHNLVVKFTDYLSGTPFFSFLGKNNISETAEKLLNFTKDNNLQPILKLIPEDSIKELDQTKFKLEEDRDHFDYVYSTKELKDLEGGKFSRKRNQLSLFLKNYPNVKAKIIDLKDKNIQAKIINLSLEWLKRKQEESDVFESHEEIAVNRLLLSIDTCNLLGVGVFTEDKLIGFLINELHASDYAIAHVSKIDRNFSGINTYLMNKNAEILYSLQKTTFNYEQDLGLENLRDAKTRFRPTKFLKKYKLTQY